MDITRNAWRQIRSITAIDLLRALKRDGWEQDRTRGATIGLVKGEPGAVNYKRVVVHYHSNKTYRPKLLKQLLADIGWDDSDLMRLKLIKKQKSKQK